MKNYFYYCITIVLLLTLLLKPQTVVGKLIDENGVGLAAIQLQLYVTPNVYNTTSLSDGSFFFNNINDVEDEGALPSGYNITNNFPNPFNPKTRIGITLPNRENVKVEVFNLLGQSVADVIEQTFDAGTNYIDIELNGLPNGFYISRITIDNKYTVIKKMMLIYGSQHLTTSGGAITTPLNKPNNTYLDTNIDSLVATSSIIGSKTFTNLPSIISDTLDLETLTIERYCQGTITVLYEGKTYNTVQIGDQCWLKENLNIGTMITSITEADSMRNNGIIEKYCYYNDVANCTTYGGLYQWNEAMQYVTTPGAQGICPTGWHIPTVAEFQTLKAAVNSDGNSLKAIGQGTGGGAGTNTSGFSALLAGARGSDGVFYTLGDATHFWSSTYYNANSAYYLWLYNVGSSIDLNYPFQEGFGFSVRCLKD